MITWQTTVYGETLTEIHTKAGQAIKAFFGAMLTEESPKYDLDIAPETTVDGEVIIYEAVVIVRLGPR